MREMLSSQGFDGSSDGRSGAPLNYNFRAALKQGEGDNARYTRYNNEHNPVIIVGQMVRYQCVLVQNEVQMLEDLR